MVILIFKKGIVPVMKITFCSDNSQLKDLRCRTRLQCLKSVVLNLGFVDQFEVQENFSKVVYTFLRKFEKQRLRLIFCTLWTTFKLVARNRWPTSI